MNTYFGKLRYVVLFLLLTACLFWLVIWFFELPSDFFVLIYCALVGSVVIHFLNQKINDLRLHVSNVYYQLQDIHSLYADVKPNFGLPGLRGFAASPDFLKILSELLISTRPAVILECGSGASTIISAYILKGLGRGKIYSLEHDSHYAEETRKRLKDHGLEQYVNVIFAPLKEVSINNRSFVWYDFDVNTIQDSIDLLIVDGPPKSSHPHARYPALPLVYGKLRSTAWILVDDYRRKSEQAMVKKWQAEFGTLVIEDLPTEKGTCKIRITKN
jgi:predicted O-methyltransferase YrrM